MRVPRGRDSSTDESLRRAYYEVEVEAEDESNSEEREWQEGDPEPDYLDEFASPEANFAENVGRVPRLVLSSALVMIAVASPLHPFLAELCELYQLAPIQINPNG